MKEYKYPSFIDRVSAMADGILAGNESEEAAVALLHDGVQTVIDEVSEAIVQFDPEDIAIVIEGLRICLATVEKTRTKTI